MPKELMSLMHCSRLYNALCLHEGFIVMYSCESSAYIMQSRPCDLMTSSRGAKYNMNRCDVLRLGFRAPNDNFLRAIEQVGRKPPEGNNGNNEFGLQRYVQALLTEMRGLL